EPLKAGQNEVLLTGDGEVLALEWEVDRGSRVLAIANGSFLLNLPLVNPARRPLAQRVVAWIGAQPRRVAFVEGPLLLGESAGPPTLIDLVARIKPFRWVALHLGLFGLLACLARAPRLGRPSPDAPSDADRPAAHAEAVGALLERSRGAAAARDLLETYRRWRVPRPPQEASRPPEPKPRRNGIRESTTKYRESTTKDTKYTKKDNELTPARNHRSRCRIEPAASSLVRSADLHLFRVFRVFRGSWHFFSQSRPGPGSRWGPGMGTVLNHLATQVSEET